LDQEQTVSCSMMSVAFYLSDVNVKLPVYTPWSYTGEVAPGTRWRRMFIFTPGRFSSGGIALVLNEQDAG